MNNRLITIANSAFKTYKRVDKVVTALEALGLLVDGEVITSGYRKPCSELYGIMTDSIDTIAAVFGIEIMCDDGVDDAFEAIEHIIQNDASDTSVKNCGEDLSESAIEQLTALAAKYPVENK